MATITESELLDALREALEPTEDSDGAMTAKEIMVHLNLSERRAYRLIHEMNEAGSLEPVKVRRVTIAGHVQRTTAYRLKNGKLEPGHNKN